MYHAPKAFGLENYAMSEYINQLLIDLTQKEQECIKLGVQSAKMYDELAKLANYLIAEQPNWIEGKEGTSFVDLIIGLVKYYEDIITETNEQIDWVSGNLGTNWGYLVEGMYDE